MKKIGMLIFVIMMMTLVTTVQAEVRAGGLPELMYDHAIKECGCPPCCPKDVRAGGFPEMQVDKNITDCGVSPCFKEPVVEAVPAHKPIPVAKPRPEPVAEKTAESVPAKEKVTVTLNVEFDTNKAIVKEKYYDDIKRVADFMKENPDSICIIEGHTDNIGNGAFNKVLSEKRAKNVRQYIINKFGIDGKRIKASGFGEEVPIAGNDTAEGRQKNRRVEAVLETK